MPTALIVDDKMDDLLALSEIFREQGFATETAQDLGRARDILLGRMPEVALFNEQVGGKPALDLLAQVDLSAVMEIYLMSDERDVETATRAMQLGISDYFRKPVDRDRLVGDLEHLVEEISCPADEGGVLKNARGLMVGESTPMQRMYRVIRKSAPSEASILIIGESGAGKELVAQTIHELSERSACDLVPVNCSAIAGELMESELFGHEKGSFTGATDSHRGFFERAAGGTLFLDEITEMDPGLQAKLLRALETNVIRRVGGEEDINVDVRVIAAMNKEPKEALEAGRLREDLYYRLAQFPIRVPPLRERGEDIDRLARHFVRMQNEIAGVDKTLGEEVLETFRLYDWPGNVRELKNAVVHGHLLAGDEIGMEDLPEQIRAAFGDGGAPRSPGVGASIRQVERDHILRTLEHFEGDKKKAAETLGISLKTLYNRLKEYGE